MAAAQTETRLPEISATGIYASRIRDRNPNLSPAGKLTATGDSAALCMMPDNVGQRPNSPEVVRRFRATLRPDAGKTRVFYGKASDPHLKWASEMTHGLATQPSILAGDLLNPAPNSRFKQAMFDKKEMLYMSHQKGPLGTSHDQRTGMPKGLDPMRFTFGIQTEKDGSAGELINPNKPYPQVDMEYETGRDLYIKTHRNFHVGEQCDRNYHYPSYKHTARFGIPTPHDNAGKHVKKTLEWLHDSQSQKAAPIVSKRVDDFRERTQPQLGKVHDPIKDTLTVGPDHTFGIMIKPDEYGAGDLLHGRAAGNYLRGKDRMRGVISAMRQHLKKANYHNFNDLLSAFKYYDKNGSGRIDINDLREACVKFNLPVEPELLEQMMDACDSDGDGLINYLEFSNFLNWKDKMPSGFPVVTEQVQTDLVASSDLKAKSPQQKESTPKSLQHQIDKAIGQHRTSANMINAVIGPGGISTKDYRKYGIPTIRSDIPAPRIRRIDDNTNYGDESDAYGLTNPSIYSIRGVFEKDFLIPRSKEEIYEIFKNIGARMTLDDFDNVYNMAAKFHPKGEVSVESFRNVLDQCQALTVQNKQN